MSNFISIGIRNVLRTIKLHRYRYRDDNDYVKKIDEYEKSLSATLNEIENIELKMELNIRQSGNLSIHELTETLENGIGGLIYYYYGIKEYLSTVSNTLHNREMREFIKFREFMEKLSESEDYSKVKEEILKVWKDGDINE